MWHYAEKVTKTAEVAAINRPIHEMAGRRQHQSRPCIIISCVGTHMLHPIRTRCYGQFLCTLFNSVGLCRHTAGYCCVNIFRTVHQLVQQLAHFPRCRRQRRLVFLATIGNNYAYFTIPILGLVCHCERRSSVLGKLLVKSQ